MGTNTQPPRNKRETALQQQRTARVNLLLMSVLTALNIVLFATGSESMLLFSATIPYFLAIIGISTGVQQLMVFYIGAAAVIIGLYILCWGYSKKHYGWMIAALVLFVVDTLAMASLYIGAEDFSGILDVLIHGWVLYYLVIGIKAGYTLKHLSPEEEHKGCGTDFPEAPSE